MAIQLPLWRIGPMMILGFMAVCSGCGGSAGQAIPDAAASQRSVAPSDFSPPPLSPPSPPSSPSSAPSSAPAATPSPAATASTEAVTADRDITKLVGHLPKPTVTTGKGSSPLAGTYAVDGMVGQVNGQALYASHVFDPLEAELTRLGQTLSVGPFRQEARRVIGDRLGEIVFNALILGEAERDLSDQEQFGLNIMMKQRREELIRKWGSGSEQIADQKLRQSKNQSLDETLSDMRKQTIVQRYLTMQMLPKINVTRKDIERYYNDHHDQYHPKPYRTIRLIRTDDATSAKQIAQGLTEGKSFAELASLSANQYRRDQSGLFGEKITGDQIFNQPALNDAMLKLNAGQTSAAIELNRSTYWVHVQEKESGRERPLRDVQGEIERELKAQRYQTVMRRYRQKLFDTGIYNPLDAMAESLTEIAISRYVPASKLPASSTTPR